MKFRINLSDAGKTKQEVGTLFYYVLMFGYNDELERK